MADHSLGALLRRLQQHQLPAPPGEGLADADLLRLFAAHRDGRAFELLLWRHGPMVLATCRRLLRHEQDAEDAFQATFLVLARKAGSVARGQALAGWLHRVACRVALRACRARRDTVPLGEVIAPENNAPLWSELRGVLDEEVGRLPARYREPFVLCHFQGKTHAEAARELGCPPGTIASRLHWARQRLRARLAGRGVAFPAT